MHLRCGHECLKLRNSEEGIGTENKQKVAVRILTNRVPPVLRTPERKPGAENAGQTYSRNCWKNLADRKKIIIAVPAKFNS